MSVLYRTYTAILAAAYRAHRHLKIIEMPIANSSIEIHNTAANSRVLLIGMSEVLPSPSNADGIARVVQAKEHAQAKDRIVAAEPEDGEEK